MLQRADSFGVPYMFFAAQPEGIFTAHVERIRQNRIGAKGAGMTAHRLLGDLG